MPRTVDLLQGTLELLILKAVSLRPQHGYGILLRIQALSREVLQVPQGSLYPALYRLQHRGFIASAWGESDAGRRARFYRLTAKGRRRLREATDEWNRFSLAMANVLHSTPEEA